MKIVKPSVKLMPFYGIGKDMISVIEEAGRVCYKSTPKDENDSIILKLIKNGHTSVLEHGNIVFVTDEVYSEYIRMMATASEAAPYIRYSIDGDRFVVSGNARAWYTILDQAIDYDVDDELPEEISNIIFLLGDTYPVLYGSFVEKLGDRIKKRGSQTSIVMAKSYDDLSFREYMMHSRITFSIITDRGVTHEIVRHRHLSFSQESTRYCNYSKDRFGNEISFIEPSFFLPVEVVADNFEEKEKEKLFLSTKEVNKSRNSKMAEWKNAMDLAEQYYFVLLNSGATPQEARTVLPNSTASTIVVTGYIDQWDHFRKLRVASSAHPQMREIAKPLINMLNNEVISQDNRRK